MLRIQERLFESGHSWVFIFPVLHVIMNKSIAAFRESRAVSKRRVGKSAKDAVDRKRRKSDPKGEFFMKDSIYTIPVSEVFEPMDGCPICRLRDTLESRCVEYIMGAAMMEPDIRIETNKAGFCSLHFKKMLGCRNRLSIALMLESHLDYLKKEIFEQKNPQQRQGLFGKTIDRRSQQAQEMTHSCYVCDKIEWALSRMVDTTLGLWEKEESFRQLYAKQPVLCLEHYALLSQRASEKLSAKALPGFLEATTLLTKRYLDSLKEDVSGFCRLYDYRSAGQGEPSEQVRTSIERAIWYLTSRDPAKTDET